MRKEYSGEALNRLRNQYKYLTHAGFIKNNRETLRAVQWSISCARNLNHGFGNLISGAWKQYKRSGLNDEKAHHEFMEWVYKLEADLDTYFKSQWNPDTQQPKGDNYINEDILKDFQSKTSAFNFEKLITLIEEINFNYSPQKVYASCTLLRAILDHIPPLLGQQNFDGVANQYHWGTARSSKRKAIKELENFRNTADDVLHSPISNKADVVDFSYLPNKFAINTLLRECLESKVKPSTKTQPISKTRKKKQKVKIPDHYPAVGVVINSSGGGQNYGINLSFVNSGDKPAILEELQITDEIKIKLDKQNMLPANNEPRQYGTLKLDGSKLRMKAPKNSQLAITYRDLSGTRYKSTYKILTKKRADGLFNVEGLADLNIKVSR